MTIATFDPVAFKVRYPEFAGVTDATLAAYFDEAGLYLSNTDAGIVQNVPRRTRLLWMLTAHIGALSGVLSPDGQAKPVGRVSAAAEGSVSASLEYIAPGSNSWFTQTQYGAAFWQATANLRGMRYVPCPTRY